MKHLQAINVIKVRLVSVGRRENYIVNVLTEIAHCQLLQLMWIE